MNLNLCSRCTKQATFSGVNIFQHYFLQCSSFVNTIRISISLDPDYVRHSVGPHLGPSCSRKQTCPVAKELMWPFGQFSIKKKHILVLIRMPRRLASNV